MRVATDLVVESMRLCVCLKKFTVALFAFPVHDLWVYTRYFSYLVGSSSSFSSPPGFSELQLICDPDSPSVLAKVLMIRFDRASSNGKRFWRTVSFHIYLALWDIYSKFFKQLNHGLFTARIMSRKTYALKIWSWTLICYIRIISI